MTYYGDSGHCGNKALLTAPLKVDMSLSHTVKCLPISAMFRAFGSLQGSFTELESVVA